MVGQNIYFNNNVKYINENKKHYFNSPTKVVFSEPYENLPPFHIDNKFIKGRCDYVSRPKQTSNPFDLSKILPLFGALGGGKGLDLSKLVGGLSSDGNNPIMNLLSNKDLMNLASKLLSKTPKNKEKSDIISTDFPIKDYVRVE